MYEAFLCRPITIITLDQREFFFPVGTTITIDIKEMIAHTEQLSFDVFHYEYKLIS